MNMNTNFTAESIEATAMHSNTWTLGAFERHAQDGTAPFHIHSRLRFTVLTSSPFRKDQPAGGKGHQIFTCLGWKWLEPKWLMMYEFSPWVTSTLCHDQVIKWAKEKVRVNSDSVMCLGKMHGHSEENEKWKDQISEFQ